MRSLSRTQALVLLLILIAFAVILAASIAILRTPHPPLWHGALASGPDIISHI